MTRTELVRLARVGAEARLWALQREIQVIEARFPDLLRSKSRRVHGEDTTHSARRRKSMSATARKRIAAAQKRRWAAWRKEKTKKGAR
jgi:hypothetical protein